VKTRRQDAFFLLKLTKQVLLAWGMGQKEPLGFQLHFT